MSEAIAQVLERAAARCERGWCRGVDALDKAGQSVPPESMSATRWCVYGAVHCDTNDSARFMALDFFASHIRALISHWNDAPERTQQEVVAALREAARRAREGAKP